MMEFYRDTFVDKKNHRINENTLNESNSYITEPKSGTQKNSIEHFKF
jgi:hypothetical protein